MGPASDSDGVLLARQVVFREFGHILSADHVRFDPCHPYIDRLDGLIWAKMNVNRAINTLKDGSPV